MASSPTRSPALHFHNAGVPTTSSQWQNIFEHPVEENDPIWKDYVEQAALFDNRMIDQWNKVIDVVLVYAALFTAIVTSFTIQTSLNFQPDPVGISNKLLVAIYKNQLATLQNSSPFIINTTDLFQPDPPDHDTIISNAILFTSLSLAVMVSIIALFAKLWVTTYNYRVNLSGSLYERARTRQKAYSGVLAWRLGTIIDLLPFLLLVDVVVFGFFVNRAIGPNQGTTSTIVWLMFNMGLYFLLLVSIAAAFIAACPFHSLLSTTLKLPFKVYGWIGAIIAKLSSRFRQQWMVAIFKIFANLVLCGASSAVGFYLGMGYYSLHLGYISFLWIAAVLLWIREDAPNSHKKPICELYQWVLFGSVATSTLSAVASFYESYVSAGLIFASVGLGVIVFVFGLLMFPCIPDTWKPDAVTWMLKSTSSQKLSLFQKAGQIARASEHRKALLLTSLLPLLSSLILSLDRHGETDDSHIQDLEVYVACLAQLSAFTDREGSFWKNEAALAHPSLPDAESLVAVLEKLGKNSNPRLSGAAKEVLRYYGVRPQLGETELP